MSTFETATAKLGVSIKPVQLLDNYGMKSKDLKIAESLIGENEDLIEQRWEDFFQK